MEIINQFRSYLISKKIDNPITLKNYLSDVRHFLNWYEKCFGAQFYPTDFSEEIIKLYEGTNGASIMPGGNLNHAEKMSLASMKRRLSSLRQFSKYLSDNGQIEENPFEAINNSKLNSKVLDIWHIAEFKDYLKFKKASDLTIKNYVTDIHSFRRWYEHAIEIEAEEESFPIINDQIIEDYKNRLVDLKSSAPRTVNRKLSSLRKFIEFGLASNFITREEIVAAPHVENVALQNNESEVLSRVSLNDIEDQKVKINYSPFPPIRLFQTLLVLPYLLLENLIAGKVIAFFYGQKAVVVAAKKLSNIASETIPSKPSDLLKVKGYEKEFYAPNQISLDTFPLYRKVWHHLRYSRPEWYKRYHSIPVVHYIHFAVLVIFAVGAAIALYRNLVTDVENPLFAAPSSPPRILSFQGRLTDNFNNPITTATDVRFSIYDDISASGSALLWQEVHYNTIPDQDGIFSVLLGTNNPIPDNVFFEHDEVYLGVTIEQTSELTPRRRIASVPYAANSEALQGMLPITDGSAGTTNVVLALDSAGDLTIGGAANPTFSATGGQFTLSGDVLFLTTETGTNSNVIIAPDGLGTIDLQKPLTNNSANGNLTPGGVEVNDKFGVLATESAVAAFTLNNDGASDLFTASSSGVTRFTIENDGTLTIPVYNTAGGIFYANGAGTLAQTTSGSSGECLQSVGGGTPIWGSCGSGNLWKIISGAISPINESLDLLIGSSATSSAKFAVINVADGTPTATISANSGNNATFLTGNGNLGTTNSQTLALGGASTGNITLSPLNGAGTTLVNGKLQIANITSFDNTIDGFQQLGTGDLTTTARGDLRFNFDSNNNGANMARFFANGNTTEVFRIDESGNIFGAAGSAYDTLTNGTLGIGTTNATTITIGRTGEGITLPTFTTNGGLLYTNGSGALAQTTSGSSGECLQSVGGGTPIWGTCGSGSLWRIVDGAISPLNDTLDLLIGSSSTTSAKFAVLNVNGTGPATASVSGNLIVMPHNGAGGLAGIGTINPLSTLDVRGQGSSTPVASFSGQTSASALVVDNAAGSGNQITAYKSGEEVFSVDNNGNIVVGPGGAGKITAAVIDPYLIQNQYTSGNTQLTFQTMATSNGDFVFQNQSNSLATLFQEGLLHLEVNGSAGGLQLGDDTQIFRGAADRIDISSGDSLNLVSGNYQLAGNTIIDSLGNATFNNLTLNGSCTGCVPGNETPFMEGLGIIYPKNSTLDFLIGGQSTDSAKFAVLNVNGNGPATASVSGNIIAMPHNGAGGRVGIGTVNPSEKLEVTGNIRISDDINGALVLGRGDNVNEGGQINFLAAGSYDGWIFDSYQNDLRHYTNSSNTNQVQIMNVGAGTAGLYVQGKTGIGTTTPISQLHLTRDLTDGAIGKALAIFDQTENQDIFTASASGNTRFVIKNNGLVGIGTSLPSTTLDVEGGNIQIDAATTLNPPDRWIGRSTNFSLSFDNGQGALLNSPANLLFEIDSDNSDADVRKVIFAKNGDQYSGGETGEGTHLFVINESGTLQAPLYNTNGGLLYANASGVFGQTGAGNFGECLISAGGGTPAWGSCGTGTTASPFTYLSGAIIPLNSTLDFLIGGQATSSAKFAVLNMTSGTPTASISATSTGNGISLGGDGIIQSLRNNTLTLGGNTTGNINIRPKDGLGSVIVNSSAFEVYSASGFGSASNYTSISTGGDLSFVGTADYLIPSGGKYAFRYSGDEDYGLFFDDSAGSYDFRNGTASNVFRVNASTGALTSSAYTTNGGLLYANASGLLSQTGAGTTSQCLLGGTTPTWGSCGTGTTASPFQTLNGAIVPLNSTLDFFIGGQATDSAKFAVLNVNGTGPATASVSGNLTVMPHNGAGGRVGIGTTNPPTRLSLTGTGTTNGISFEGGNTRIYTDASNGAIRAVPANGWFAVRNGADTADNLLVSDSYTRARGLVCPGNQTTVCLGGDTSALFVESGNFGIGTASPIAALHVTGGQKGGNAAFILNQTGASTNDILTASSSGTTRLTLNNAGQLALSTQGNTGGLLIGGDTNLYRNGADILRTDDALDVGTKISVGSTITSFDNTAEVLQSLGSGDLTMTARGDLRFNFDSNNNGANMARFFANGNTTEIFRINESGSVLALAGSTYDTLTNGTLGIGTTTATTITIGRTGQGITFPGFNCSSFTNGGKLTTTTGGVLTCANDGGSSTGGAFQELNGAIVPNNSTLDFLLGGAATPSAKFAVLNLNGNGPATASVSGNMIVMPHNGAGGRVGIGTTTPSSLLAFASGTTSEGGITFGNDANLFRSGTSTLSSINNLFIGSTSPSLTNNSFNNVSNFVVDDNSDDYYNILAKLASDDFFRIAYNDDNNGNLYYSQCTNIECDTPNTTEVVNLGGYYADIEGMIIGNDDYGRIVYNDNFTYDLKFVQCTNADCSTNNTSTIDSGDDSELRSLVLGNDGFARMVFSDYGPSPSELKFVQCTNADCSTNNQTVLYSNYESMYQDMVIGSDGFARMVVTNETDGDLEFIQCTNASCSTRNTTAITSGNNDYSQFLALGSDGFGRVVYTENSSDDLIYLQCTNASCSTNSSTVINSGGYTESHVATLDSSGYARIVFTDYGSDELKYLQCTNASCSTNNVEVLADASIYDFYAYGITLDSNGYPRIVYQNDDNYRFYLLECDNASCSSSQNTFVDQGSFDFDNIAVGLYNDTTTYFIYSSLANNTYNVYSANIAPQDYNPDGDDLYVAGDIGVAGNIYTDGALSVGGQIDAQSNLNVGGNLNVDGVATFSNNALFLGQSEFEGNVTMNYSLNVYSGAYIYSGLYVDGGISLSGNFTQNGGFYTSLGVPFSAGASNDIYVSGKYAYLANGTSGLRIIDITVPSSTSILSTYDTSGTARSVFTSGKYAYVADGTSGLQIIDVSNPNSPSLVSTLDTSGDAYEVYVSGKYAYVADDASGLHIIDVSNPASPTLTGTYNTSGNARGVYVLGKYAYVADGTSGLQIIDVSNPASPTLTGAYNSAGTATDVYVSGRYAYLADTSSFIAVNVSSPSSPSAASSYSMNASKVVVGGGYAYVADGSSSVRIVNVSNPSSIYQQTSYCCSAPTGVALSGKYLYTSANSTTGFNVYDIYGINTPALYAGDIQTNEINVTENGIIGNDLYVRNGLMVGDGGIQSQGGLGIYSGLSTNIIQGQTPGNALLTLNQNSTQDIFTASASGTTRFVINNAGNVGIGTSNPGVPLQIMNNAASIYLSNVGESISSQWFLAPGDNNFLTGVLTGDSGFSLHNTLSGFAIGNNATGVQFRIGNNGNVGVGTYNSPTGVVANAKLQVYSNLGTTPAASISAKSTTAPALLITKDGGANDLIAASYSGNIVFKLGNTGGVTIYNNLLPATDNAINLGSSSFAFNTVYANNVLAGGSDFAEYFKKADPNEQFEAGQLVCQTQNEGVTRCDSDNPNQRPLGAISDNAALVGGRKHAEDPNYVLVGLVGQLRVHVTGDVEVGDPLTLSPVTGAATKATNEGPIIGYAMESNTGGKQRVSTAIKANYYNPNMTLNYSGDNTEEFIASLNLSEEDGRFKLTDMYGNIVKRVSAFSDVITANLKSGSASISKLSANVINGTTATISNISTIALNASNATVGTLTVGTENVVIAGTNLRDYVAGIVEEVISDNVFTNGNEIISPIASIDRINTNIISPLGDGASVEIEVKPQSISVNNTNTGEKVVDIDNSGNATFSGSLASNSLTTNDATISGTLSADRIIANTIDGLDDRISSVASNLISNNSSSNSGSLSQVHELEVGNLYADFGIYSEGLTVLGATTTTSLTAMDTIAIGTGFIMSENSINTLGATLEIQPLRQGDISFMAGKVKIDTDGNVDINGNLNIAGKINAVEGVFNGIRTNSLATNIISPLPDSDLVIQLGNNGEASSSGNLRVANASGEEVLKISGEGNIVASGSATFDKLNFNLVGEALANTDTTAVATGSAGFATINKNKPELTIYNDKITKDSLIYITPFGNTQNKVLHLLRQVPQTETTDGSFTVGISGTPATIDIQFNWLIVN